MIFQIYLTISLISNLLTVFSSYLPVRFELLASSLSLVAIFLLFLSFSMRIFRRGLPWTLLMIHVLLFVWANLLAYPLPTFLSLDNWISSLSWISIGVCLFSFVWIKFHNYRRTGRATWLFEAVSEDSGFSFFRSFSLATVSLALIMAFSVSYLSIAVPGILKHFTAGFIEINGKGVFTEYRVYSDSRSRAHLFGMTHVGSTSFYEQAFGELSPRGSLHLLEGVRDEKGLLKDLVLSYEEYVPEALSLQKEHDLTGIEAISADVDASELSPVTIKILKGMQNNQFGQITTSEDLSKFFTDIIDYRNKRLMEVFQEQRNSRLDLVIPWGAAHMPGIIEELEKMDYRLISKRKLPIFLWEDLAKVKPEAAQLGFHKEATGSSALNYE